MRACAASTRGAGLAAGTCSTASSGGGHLGSTAARLSAQIGRTVIHRRCLTVDQMRELMVPALDRS